MAKAPLVERVREILLAAGDRVLNNRPIPDYGRGVVLSPATEGTVLGLALVPNTQFGVERERRTNVSWARVDFGIHGIFNAPISYMKKSAP
jgi:hypothetical protein